jgi:branched-chain amino acid transport system substrate-binding protein
MVDGPGNSGQDKKIISKAKKLLLAVLILSVAFASVEAAEPIKIGVSLGISGKYAEIADVQLKAFRLWEKDINQRGGILGRKITLIIYNDKSDPRTAIDAYRYMIMSDKVDLLFAPYSSEITEAILPVTGKYGYPIIASGASEFRQWQKANKYLFGIYSPSSEYSVGFLELLTRQGFENIAIVYTEETFSKSVASGAKKWAERFGLRIALFSSLGRESGDALGIAKEIRGLRAQALIVCGYFNDAVNMRLAMKKIGWHPRAYYAVIGPTLPAYTNRLRRDADYAFSSSQWELAGKIPGSRAFHDSFTKTYGEKPSYHAATAFAAGEILEAAVKKAQAIDREKIKNVLSSMEVLTIMGRYGDDRKTGKQIKQFSLIIQNQRGKREIVWPEYLRTSKPLFGK